MGMRAMTSVSLVWLACGVLSACEGVSSSGDGDCVSRYEPVAEAATRDGLRDAMLGYEERGRVVSLRTQERGDDVGVGGEDAVRVVDLLSRDGRRIVQVEVWRADGLWHAGVWSQCID